MTKTDTTKTYADEIRARDPLAWECEGAKVAATELVAGLMERQKVTKTELAKRLGVSQAAVTGYLKGSRNLTLEKLAELLFVLGCRLELRAKRLAGPTAGGRAERIPRHASLRVATVRRERVPGSGITPATRARRPAERA